MSAEEKAGFEWRDRFYPWSFTNIAKDQMLLQRIARMPPSEFVEAWGDLEEGEQTVVMVTLIATSLRAGHPEWSVDRLQRIAENLDLVADLTYINPGEQDDASPPAEAAMPPTSVPGRSPSNGSSPPSTPSAASTSETSYGTPV